MFNAPNELKCADHRREHAVHDRTVRRFTPAHELAHRIIGGAKGDLKLEKAMDCFVAAFLIPKTQPFPNEVAGARDALPPIVSSSALSIS